MGTIREARYSQLRRLGLLKSEALAFSKFDIAKVPYLARLIAQRRVMVNRFNIEHTKMKPEDRQKLWDKQVAYLFQRNGWTKQWNGKAVVDPWAELRSFENPYKVHHRQYESPHVKRNRDFASFQRKFEKSMSYNAVSYAK